MMEWMLLIVAAVGGGGLVIAATYGAVRKLMQNGSLGAPAASPGGGEALHVELVKALLQARSDPEAAPVDLREKVEGFERRLTAMHEEIVEALGKTEAERKRAEGARSRAEQLKRQREGDDDDDEEVHPQVRQVVDNASDGGYSPDRRDPRAELAEVEEMIDKGEI